MWYGWRWQCAWLSISDVGLPYLVEVKLSEVRTRPVGIVPMGWFNGVDLKLVIAYPFNQSAVDVGAQCAFGLSINRCSLPVHS